MIKEATASAFVFRRDADGVWLLALVWHPRLAGWLPAGGHVEREETAAEGALREIREETGYRARLMPGPAVPLPEGFPHASVVAPWWIVEMAACADGHTGHRHVHLDHVFVAVLEEEAATVEPEHRVRWFSERELAEAAKVGEDSRLQAKHLFARIGEIAAVDGSVAS